MKLANKRLHRTRRNRCAFGDGRRQRAIETAGGGSPVMPQPLAGLAQFVGVCVLFFLPACQERSSSRYLERPQRPTPPRLVPEPPVATQGMQPTRALPAGTTTATSDVPPFIMPLPPRYYDATAQVPKGRIALAFVATEPRRGYQPSITIQKAPLPGGSLDDPDTCARTGRGIIAGGTEAPGTGGVLKSARIIDGPVGRTCQIHLVGPDGVAIITELHRPGNTLVTPQDIWLMTCNHADGDDIAESICRSTLSAFRYSDP